LLYDNITTSYPLNLPVDYYHRYVKNSIAKDENEKWFIRPHHVETVSQHPQSIKDDVFNTHYFAHYK
jgi:hypothetical protein